MTAALTLPTAELHLHIEGTLEPELALKLAGRNGVELPFASVEELRAAYRFTDLQSFLDLYYACMAVLRTRADFRDLAAAYLTRAAAEGVRHAEIFFDAQAHTARGVPYKDVVGGLQDALDGAARLGMTGGLILCFLRDAPVEEAEAVWAEARRQPEALLGVGLDSAEVGNPATPFAHLYAEARALGLHAVAHAGEEGGPEYVWEALRELRAERIDHGIRSLEDPQLVRHLAEHRIPLTVCPFSNVRLRAVPSLAEHPLPAMLAAGLRVTVNSDDPAYFGGYAGQNLAAVAEQFGLDRSSLAELARNSVTASFAPDGRQAELLGEIDAWEAGA
ncbi:adenosine deaminase [Sinomonas cellulolyticus]|uniref:Adenine deaminase n=1 Tax=Sinomonas cellulolyticus TaxID=2801916 RepID=A0ABS1JXV3_9MICC|nr:MULTISPECIES: adenosine deaminase [Sinomonas]MBL0704209.1 adenosine deaminase [Sinomonas cellulolyticus]